MAYFLELGISYLSYWYLSLRKLSRYNGHVALEIIVNFNDYDTVIANNSKEWGWQNRNLFDRSRIIENRSTDQSIHKNKPS